MSRESRLGWYVAMLFRGRWIILFTLFAFTSLVALLTFATKPVYEASSLVLIDTKESGGSLPLFDITGAATANKISNELEILKSNANAEAVARSLISRKYIDDRASTVMAIVRPDEDADHRDSLADVSTVVARLSDAVRFTPLRESDIIRITARSTNPEEAAVIANAYTEIYTTRNLEASRLRSQAVREFLQSQLQSERSILDTAEQALQSYMKVSGIVSLDVEANKIVGQLSQLEALRDGAEVEKNACVKTLAAYKEEFARQEPNAARAIDESNDNYISLLQEQLAKLEVQRDIVIAQNPEMVDQKIYSEKMGEIDSQIASLKKRLGERTKVFLNSLLPSAPGEGSGNASFLGVIKQKIIEQQVALSGIEARIKTLNDVIAEYDKQFNQIPQKSIELAKLQRARLSSEKLYLFLEEKYNESAIKEKSEFGYVNIIDPAIVSAHPVSPNVALNIVLGILFGLAFGVGIVFVRELIDLRIQTPEDLKRRGFVPLSTIASMNGELNKIEENAASSDGVRSLDRHLVSHHRRLSPVAESYRHLRTSVQYVRVDLPPRCIIITSVNPQEGKTTTVANLAIAFSQAEKKILLVDADMHRSRIHAMFGLKNSRGLTEYLFGKAPVEGVIERDVLPNLDIITSGAISANPSEALGSKKMKEFIDAMKRRYDMVLFDTPPILAVTDAAVLGTNTDGAVLVVSAGETSTNGLERAAEFLAGINVKILGVVLNRFDVREAYGGNYHAYQYGYYSYESDNRGGDGEHQQKKLSLGRLFKHKNERTIQ